MYFLKSYVKNVDKSTYLLLTNTLIKNYSLWHCLFKVLNPVIKPIHKDRLAPQKTQTNDMQASLFMTSPNADKKNKASLPKIFFDQIQKLKAVWA